MTDRPMTESEAAAELGISKATLMRDRLAGRVFPHIHGKRTIRYTTEILEEYKQLCKNAPAKSETTGSHGAQVRSSGAEPGTTKPVDRHSAHLLAQRIFKKAS